MPNLRDEVVNKITDKLLSESCEMKYSDGKMELTAFTTIYDNLIGKIVVVRTYSAGVFYGKLQQVESDTLILNQCRRIWCWYGANSLSDIALKGVADKSQSKICPSIDNHLVKNFIEIIPCNEIAIENLNSVPNWSK